MDPYSFYYDYEYVKYYKRIGDFLDRNIDFKGKEILCLASGTGQIQRRYIDNGAKSVVCVEISKSFLDIFGAKIVGLPEYSKKITLIKQDMTKFNFKRKFDLVFLLGNSFCHLMTQEQQISCLKRIKKHLKKDGRAYLHIMPLSDKMNDNFRLKRSFFDKNNLPICETAKVKMCYPDHRLDFQVQWKSKSGIIKKTLHTRIMTTPEMQLLLKLIGLKTTNIYYNYSKRKNMDAAEWIYEVKK